MPLNEVQNTGLEPAESFMLDLPQVECPVVHHFGPGIYIREVTIPAGTIAVGHAQRYEQLNILLRGSVAVVNDGEVKVLRAPLIFTGPPGRKVGYVIEDAVWQNVYATEETDIEKLEEMFLDKSASWQAHQDEVVKIERAARAADRHDFALLVAEAGFTLEQVRQQSENETDQIPFPDSWQGSMVVRDSTIEGKGMFLSFPAKKGDVLAPARLDGMRTPAGRYVNHAKHPNAEFVKNDNEDIYLVALRDIHGCVGGNLGEEVTVDYRQALSLSGIYLDGGKL